MQFTITNLFRVELTMYTYNYFLHYNHFVAIIFTSFLFMLKTLYLPSLLIILLVVDIFNDNNMINCDYYLPTD